MASISSAGRERHEAQAPEASGTGQGKPRQAEAPTAQAAWAGTLASLTKNPATLKAATAGVNPKAELNNYTYSVAPLTVVELDVNIKRPGEWNLEIDGPALVVEQLADHVTEICTRNSPATRATPASRMTWLRLDGGPLAGAYVIRWSTTTALTVRSREQVAWEMRFNGGGSDVESYLRGRC